MHVVPSENRIWGSRLRGDVDGNGDVFALVDALTLLSWSSIDGLEPRLAWMCPTSITFVR